MSLRELNTIHSRLRACRACPRVCGTPVHGPALATQVMIVGQAPGVYEAPRGRPFAHTAGKTLFQWLEKATGLGEDEVRELIYFSAVARCFPGKNPKGAGDREPSLEEIENCRPHLRAEIAALQPKVILAVGKVAIREVLGPEKFPKSAALESVVGKKITARFHGHDVTVISLPHPSGISRWPKMEPGKTKLAQALRLVKREVLPLLS